MRRWLVLLAVAWLLGAGTALHVGPVGAQEVPVTDPAATAQAAPAAAGQSTSGAQGQAQDLTNPKTQATLVDNTENELVIHTTDVPVGILGNVNSWGINFFTITPPELTYANQDLQTLWVAIAIVAGGAFGLSQMWAGFKIIHAPWSGAKPVRDLWLVGFGAIGIMGSLLFCRFVIDLNNILCTTVGAANPKDMFLSRPGGNQNDLALLVAGMVFEFMAVIVSLKLLIRMAMVMLLVAVSGAGFYAWTQPETKWLGDVWMHGFVGWTLGQFLTVMVLKTGLLLTSRIDPNSGTGTTIGAYILGIAVMLLAGGLPDLLGRIAGVRSGVPGVLTTAATMAIGMGGRALAGAGAGAGAAIAGGASAAAPAVSAASSVSSSGWTNSATRKAANFVPGGMGPQHA